MTRTGFVGFLLLLPALVAPTADALAQEPRFAVAVKGGISAENSEDNLRGTSPALGITASVGFAHGWRGEAEFWLPDYINDANGDPKHRDILFSFSALKAFQAGKVRPFLVAGLSVTNTQDWFSFCTANRAGPGGSVGPVLVSCDEPDVIERRRERNDGKDGYLLVGGGIEYPITRHLGVMADVRFSLAPVSVIVRPALGVVFTF